MANRNVREFEEGLTALCRKHNAVLFPRKDSKQPYISAEIGGGSVDRVWIDFLRISGDGVERAASLLEP